MEHSEGAEKDSSCRVIVSNTLSHHIQLEGDLEIMHAHGTHIIVIVIVIFIQGAHFTKSDIQ